MLTVVFVGAVAYALAIARAGNSGEHWLVLFSLSLLS